MAFTAAEIEHALCAADFEFFEYGIVPLLVQPEVVFDDEFVVFDIAL